MTKLEVVDVFSSLQGEGKYVGTNATFLRLRRCPLACTWCDEQRTWNKQNPEYQDYSLYTQDELVQMLRGMSANHLVITGGEPMLWQKQLDPVIAGIGAWFNMIEIETAGTILPNSALRTGSMIHFNVSPKLVSSGNKDRTRLRWDVLQEYAALSLEDRAVFKFVAYSKHDIPEIASIVEKLALRDENVYVMAEGAAVEKQLQGMRELAELVLARGWNLSPRLHILIWGNQHGK